MKEETTDSLGVPLSVLIPKSLDDIVRNNRDKAEIRLATEAEIGALFTTLTPAQVKRRIEGWWVFWPIVTADSGLS